MPLRACWRPSAVASSLCLCPEAVRRLFLYFARGWRLCLCPKAVRRLSLTTTELLSYYYYYYYYYYYFRLV